MSEPSTKQAAATPAAPQQISPLSCLPLIAGVAVFTLIIGWLSGWWLVSSNEHVVQRNMLDIARSAHQFQQQHGKYPASLQQLVDAAIIVNPPRNPYNREPTRQVFGGMDIQPGDISLHLVELNGNPPDLVIVSYGLRPVPESNRSDWTVLPGGVDPDRVLSAISVNALPAELLVVEVEETSAVEQAADRWKLPEGE